MEERVRRDIAAIVNAEPDSRLVDRLYAVVARVCETYEAYVDAVLEGSDAQ